VSLQLLDRILAVAGGDDAVAVHREPIRGDRAGQPIISDEKNIDLSCHRPPPGAPPVMHKRKKSLR
jgi:hypothetical protein